MLKNCAECRCKAGEHIAEKNLGKNCLLESLEAEVLQLKLAEEGAKEAFGAVVAEKRILEAKVKNLERLLNDAYAMVRKNIAPTAL